MHEVIARIKYRPIIKRAGLKESERGPGRNFIIIHIDALAYDYLLKAIQRGYMPFVRKLLESGAYRLALWNCGLPSATPSFQAGLLYGDSFDVCGFRWYEKDRGVTMEGKNPQSIRFLQERIARGKIPLLKGGAVYFSMLDGGAATALFTLGAMNSSSFLQNLKGVTWALLFLLNPIRFLRIFTLSVWEYARWWVKKVFRSFFPSPLPWATKPFLNIAVNILFREIQTYACLMDIYRNLPALYTNYYGYDEVAHQTGPSSEEAFRVLRGIDSQIRQIFKMCSREPFSHYDIYIMSDHGLTPSVSFREAFGRSFGDFVKELVAETAIREFYGPERAEYKGPWRKLLETLRAVSFWPSKEDEEKVPEGAVVVACSGPLAHIYFTSQRERFSLSQINAFYPGLLRKLLEHPGVGLVILKEGGEIHILSSEGSVIWEEGKARGDLHILAPYGEPEEVAGEIARLASFPHAGDITVVGAMNKRGVIVTFEDQVATHGGPGGAQTRAFILYPSHVPLEIGPRTRAYDFYRFFLNFYRQDLTRKPLRVGVKSETVASDIPHHRDTPSVRQLYSSGSGGSAGDDEGNPHLGCLHQHLGGNPPGG